MEIFSIARIPVERQRTVGESVVVLLAKVTKGKKKGGDALATRANEFMEAHRNLATVQRVPKLTIDNATDRAYSAAHGTLTSIVQTFSDPLLPLPPAAQRRANGAKQLLTLAFPKGTGFLSTEMPTQYRAMRDVVTALRSPAARPHVKTLGFGETVDYLEALLAPYGVAVKSADGRDVETLSDEWHVAYSNLAASAIGTLAESDPLRRAILNAYEKELAAQRADQVARRRKRAAKNATQKTT